jgi:hypothetical protein
LVDDVGGERLTRIEVTRRTEGGGMGKELARKVQAAVVAAAVVASTATGHGARLDRTAKVALDREAARRTRQLDSGTARHGQTTTSGR